MMNLLWMLLAFLSLETKFVNDFIIANFWYAAFIRIDKKSQIKNGAILARLNKSPNPTDKYLIFQMVMRI